MTIDINLVKNALVYERINDPRPYRTSNEIANIVRDTNTELIFRADWRWFPKVRKCSELTGTDEQKCITSGMSYESLTTYYNEIHTINPNTIIVAGIPTQRIDELNEKDEITNAPPTVSILSMALDPSSYNNYDANFPSNFQSRQSFQDTFNNQFQLNTGYYPDINNTDYQNLFLSWVKNQINIGADALWFDLLFYQANYFLKSSNMNFAHAAVIESFKSAVKLVNEAHNYAQSIGKTIYVGSWTVSMHYSDPSINTQNPTSYTQPQLDFVTITTQKDLTNPSLNEFETGAYDDTFWNKFKTNVYNGFGNVPIFIFLDWGFNNSPTEIFALMSTTDQQSALIAASEYFKSKGMIFVYPVHGGNVGTSSWNDIISQNPDTYNTIKQLMTSNIPPPPPPPPISTKTTGYVVGSVAAGLILYYLLKKKRT